MTAHVDAVLTLARSISLVCCAGAAAERELAAGQSPATRRAIALAAVAVTSLYCGRGVHGSSCWLSPLERGLHALSATEKGKHGRSIAAYALLVGRPQQSVSQEIQAARVASYRTCGNFADLADKCRHLAEIHASPEKCWPALVGRMASTSDCRHDCMKGKVVAVSTCCSASRSVGLETPSAVATSSFETSPFGFGPALFGFVSVLIAEGASAITLAAFFASSTTCLLASKVRPPCRGHEKGEGGSCADCARTLEFVHFIKPPPPELRPDRRL